MAQSTDTTTGMAQRTDTTGADDKSTDTTTGADNEYETLGIHARYAYQQASAAEGYVSRYVTEQPWTALLLAAAVGYALAYLIRRP